MAVMMECNECGKVQSVSIVANGKAGYVDPHQECDNPECNSVGRFSARGTKAIMERRQREALAACRDVYGKLDEIMPPKEVP